jgi:hypothetical protein
MYPLLRPGSSVRVAQADLAQMYRGDLVVVQWQDRLITHRLLSQSKQGWLTRGDNCLLPDPLFPEHAIVGHVVAIEQEHTCINIQSWKWRAINRCIGWLSALDVAMLQSCCTTTHHPPAATTLTPSLLSRGLSGGLHVLMRGILILGMLTR